MGEIIELQPAAAAAPVHWTCPDCLEPCRCTDETVRAMPHERCGVKAVAKLRVGRPPTDDEQWLIDLGRTIIGR